MEFPDLHISQAIRAPKGTCYIEFSVYDTDDVGKGIIAEWAPLYFFAVVRTDIVYTNGQDPSVGARSDRMVPLVMFDEAPGALCPAFTSARDRYQAILWPDSDLQEEIECAKGFMRRIEPRYKDSMPIEFRRVATFALAI